MDPGRPCSFLNQSGPWDLLIWSPRLIPLQWDEDGVVLGVGVMGDLVRSEDQREGCWVEQHPLQANTGNQISNRREQLFFFMLTEEPLL